MTERVQPIDLGVTWEPNAPDAAFLCDDAGRAALAQQAHFDDADQRVVVLRWDGALYATMGPPNDEVRPRHRLYDRGPKDVHWAGLVHDSELTSGMREMWSPTVHANDGPSPRLMPLHFVILSKECVVEVLADNVDVFRVAGSSQQAAVTCLGL